jgi:hypothetical protein
VKRNPLSLSIFRIVADEKRHAGAFHRIVENHPIAAANAGPRIPLNRIRDGVAIHFIRPTAAGPRREPMHIDGGGMCFVIHDGIVPKHIAGAIVGGNGMALLFKVVVFDKHRIGGP